MLNRREEWNAAQQQQPTYVMYNPCPAGSIPMPNMTKRTSSSYSLGLAGLLVSISRSDEWYRGNHKMWLLWRLTLHGWIDYMFLCSPGLTSFIHYEITGQLSPTQLFTTFWGICRQTFTPEGKCENLAWADKMMEARSPWALSIMNTHATAMTTH